MKWVKPGINDKSSGSHVSVIQIQIQTFNAVNPNNDRLTSIENSANVIILNEEIWGNMHIYILSTLCFWQHNFFLYFVENVYKFSTEYKKNV